MKSITSILIALVCVLFLSCAKEEGINPDETECLLYNYIMDTNYYESPCFNPNNADEFIFVHKNFYTGEKILYKYRISTNEKDLIYKGDILEQPDWGEQDWILLTLNINHKNLWLIKSNGDSLTQITFNNENYKATFIDQSSKIALAGEDYTTKIIDLEGNLLDVINLNSVHPVDHNFTTNTYAFTHVVQIHTVKLNGDTISHRYYDIEGGLKITSNCQWINDWELIFATQTGIYKLNTETKEKTRIRFHDEPTQYIHLDYSWISNKLIMQKTEQKEIGDKLIEVKSIIVLMATDGTNRQEIEIR
ncbi:MAG: hypothetical protein U9R19_07845 [Bacteroidota bacterium]|nr:hypothetical protein [Bacteroidota bacterium]